MADFEKGPPVCGFTQPVLESNYQEKTIHANAETHKSAIDLHWVMWYRSHQIGACFDLYLEEPDAGIVPRQLSFWKKGDILVFFKVHAAYDVKL